MKHEDVKIESSQIIFKTDQKQAIHISYKPKSIADFQNIILYIHTRK